MDDIPSAPLPQPAPRAAQPIGEPLNSAPAISALSAASGASSAPVAALVDALDYTITIPQARELFAARQRKVPAERTLQGYCAEAKLAGQKIHTTTGIEWLINASSLDRFIDNQARITSAPLPQPAPRAAQPIEVPLNGAPATAAISGASGASSAPVAAPGEIEILKIKNDFLERENTILRQQVVVKDEQITAGNILTQGLQRLVLQLSGGRPKDHQQGTE